MPTNKNEMNEKFVYIIYDAYVPININYQNAKNGIVYKNIKI